MALYIHTSLVYIVKIPDLLKPLAKDLVWNVETKRREVFITFDDGPHPDITPWVLDQLDKYDAKGTFFCVGDNISKYREIFDLIIERGHSVGNHTMNHLNGWKTEVDEYVLNVDACQKHHDFTMLRPPYGKISKGQVGALKDRFSLVMWDVLSADFDQSIDGEKCTQNVLKNVHPGAIIVFHDSEKAESNLRYALPKVLESLTNERYAFTALTT